MIQIQVGGVTLLGPGEELQLLRVYGPGPEWGCGWFGLRSQWPILGRVVLK